MVKQIFLSPQVKQGVIISNKVYMTCCSFHMKTRVFLKYVVNGCKRLLKLRRSFLDAQFQMKFLPAEDKDKKPVKPSVPQG